MLLTTGREQPRKFVTLIVVSGNTESLNYAGNDGTREHSRLTMLLGNAPRDSSAKPRLDVQKHVTLANENIGTASTPYLHCKQSS